MNRQEKIELVKDLRHSFSSEESFLVNYRGMTVADLQGLRKKLKSAGGRLKVAKSRLMRLAIENVDRSSELEPYLKDQLAVVFADSKSSFQVIKALDEFGKGRESFQIVAGIFDARLFAKADLKRIAALPPREVLLSQLCGALKAPIDNLVWTLQAQTSQLVYTLQQIADQKSQ